VSTAELQAIVEKLALSQAETDRQFKATDRKIKELGTLFTGQWGKLVESLLASGLVEVFQKWGLGVSAVSRDYEILDATGRKLAQIDVLLHNGGEDVAVEIKTTCRPKEIDEHIDRLARLRSGRREYSEGGKKLYAAVAALKYEAEADIYAEKKGFFVLKSSDGIVEIGNREGFRPRVY
jgi:hypothetical protein